MSGNTATLKFLLLAVDQASRPMRQAGDEVERTGNKFHGMGRKTALAVAGLAAGVGMFAKSSVSQFEKVTMESRGLQRALGGSLTEASRWRFAAQEAGVDAGTFTKSMQQLDKRLVAATGSQKTAAAMAKTLGMNFTDAHGKILPMSQLLPKLADRFAAMPDGADKTALAMKLFGKSGAAMLPFLGKGSEALAELRGESDKFGETLRNNAIDAVTKAKVSQREWHASLQGLKVQIGAGLLPILTDFVDFLRQSVIPYVEKLTGVVRAHSAQFEQLGSSLMQVFSGVFSGVVVPVLKAVLPLLVRVAQVISQHLDILVPLATAVGAVVAAWRTWNLAKNITTTITGAVQKLSDGIGMLRTRTAEGAGTAKSFFGTYGAGLGILGGTVGSIVAIGYGLSQLVDRGDNVIKTVESMKDTIKGFRDELAQTNGVIDANVRLSVAKQLQDSGLADKAAAAGISLRDLTAAASGSDAAMESLIKRWQESGAPSDETISKLRAMHLEFDVARDHAKQLTTVTGQHTRALGNEKGALDKTTTSMKTQTSASDRLIASIKKLSGDKIDAAQAELRFRDGIAQATTQVKENGKSLSANTEKGRANREWLLDQLSSLRDVAQAQLNAGQSTDAVTRKLHHNEDALRRAAKSAGFNKDQVDSLIRTYGQLPAVKTTHIHADDSGFQATYRRVRDDLATLGNVTISIGGGRAGGRGGGPTATAQGSGYFQGGWTRINELGQESVWLPGGARVRTHAETMSAAGMAGGSGGGDVNITFPPGVILGSPAEVGKAVGKALEYAVNAGAKVRIKQGVV